MSKGRGLGVSARARRRRLLKSRCPNCGRKHRRCNRSAPVVLTEAEFDRLLDSGAPIPSNMTVLFGSWEQSDE